jgi:hypothetical protein
MKDLIAKLSSYNLFNNLFPGVIFVAITEKMTSYSFLQNDIVVGFFVYYFIGLVISRVGSLVIEPLLQKVKFLKFVDYSDYKSACKSDTKLELLSEINNSYRAICSMLALLLVLKFYEWITNFFPLLKNYSITILVFALFIVFLYSYKKQTGYVVKSVNCAKK